MRKRTAGIIRLAHAQTGSTSRTPALLLAPEKTNCVDALALEACDLQHSPCIWTCFLCCRSTFISNKGW
ncbi:hypothetical protein R3I93_018522 [Phoxinus phoxinus]|uniref:Uncharacterized protein n=1 Tax=Phoxinus phoxinus TaxID=58324 RepID=A0AAN9CD34_9TELE